MNCLVNKYWINQGAPNEAFWAHEVSMSTSREECPLLPSLSSQSTLHAPLPLTLHAMVRATRKTPRSLTSLTLPFVDSNIFRLITSLLRGYHHSSFHRHMRLMLTIVVALFLRIRRNTSWMILRLSSNPKLVQSLTLGVWIMGPCFPRSGISIMSSELWVVYWIEANMLRSPRIQEQFGSFKSINSTTPSTCTRTGKIWYPERASGSEQDVEN